DFQGVGARFAYPTRRYAVQFLRTFSNPTVPPGGWREVGAWVPVGGGRPPLREGIIPLKSARCAEPCSTWEARRPPPRRGLPQSPEPGDSAHLDVSLWAFIGHARPGRGGPRPTSGRSGHFCGFSPLKPSLPRSRLLLTPHFKGRSRLVNVPPHIFREL